MIKDCKNNEIFNQVKGLASSGAQKICGIGTCDSDTCDRAKGCGMAMLDPCPLRKYEVTHDTRKWYERLYEEATPSEDEIWSICSMCQHSKASISEKALKVRRGSMDTCVFCPVKMAEESIQETHAEASVS